MRELKFRVWDKDTTKYVDGVGELYADILEVGTKVFRIEQMCQGRYTIEQYTGLKDKNGKEIYEGDILREKGLLSLTCVEWDKNNARYLTRVLDKSKHLSSIFYFDIIDALDCEVVGNIHDNPELIGRSI